MADYKYIKIGENLAKGNFLNDEEIVLTWFNSPGHRANLLNSQYKEIGVAVKKGFFHGEVVWLAVQHFGISLDYCLKENFESLKEEINFKKEELDKIKIFFNQKKKNIENNQSNSFFYEFLNDYNKLVDYYNLSLTKIKNLIDDYNKKIEEFNQCLKKFN